MPGLYFHIPFCDHKCIYCDFYSLPPSGDAREDFSRVRRFLGHLSLEIDLGANALAGRSVDSIFFGGGTPSLLAPGDLGRILEHAHSCFSVQADAEVTLESNPGTVDADALKAFRQSGVNRLSIGVQSFHDDDLRFLTRIHSAAEAEQAFEGARAAGFTNINLDLIFGIPGQTPEQWARTLDNAVRLAPEHLSCYSLTVEPNTALATLVAARHVVPVSTELDAELYEQTARVLAPCGYEQYEVSNFARPGYHCRHNLTYWTHGEYLGFGPSAHSFVGGRRWWNARSLGAYTDALEHRRSPVAGEESPSPDQLMIEELFLGLRSTGIDLRGFCGRHRALVPRGFDERLEELIRRDLASTDGERIRLTTKGYVICDELCASLAA
jgi:oxygen-independent coproporphyrinogen-3 oxidase